MKVLQLTINFSPNIGGLETHLDDLVNTLADKAIPVAVLTYKPLATKARTKFVERRPGVVIIRLPWFTGFFYKLLSRPALEFAYLVPGLLLATPFVILAQSITVIHAHGLVAGFAGAVWAKFFRKRLVISTHAVYDFPAGSAYRRFAGWVFARADAVLCLSDASAAEVRALGLPEPRIRRFTNWIDTDRFKPQDKLAAKDNLNWPHTTTALFVGRLVPGKGVLELLESAQYLDPGIRLVIAGSGTLEEEVKRRQSDRVEYLGPISPEAMPLYYNAADIFVMPSTQNESFGRVTIEALACGTPVVGSNRGETTTLVSDQVGLLTDPTPKSLATAINKLSSSPAELTKMAKTARKYAIDNFSSDNINLILRSYSVTEGHAS